MNQPTPPVDLPDLHVLPGATLAVVVAPVIARCELGARRNMVLCSVVLGALHRSGLRNCLTGLVGLCHLHAPITLRRRPISLAIGLPDDTKALYLSHTFE